MKCPPGFTKNEKGECVRVRKYESPLYRKKKMMDIKARAEKISAGISKKVAGLRKKEKERKLLASKR